MAWNKEQSDSQTDGAGSTTSSFAYPGAVVPGSLLLCLVRWADFGLGYVVTGVSDSVNGAWTPTEASPQTNPHAPGFASQMFFFKATAAGTPSVTVTFSDALAAARGIILVEFSGNDQTAPFDKHAAASGNTGAPTAGPQTPTTDGQLIVGGVLGFAGDVAIGSGFTSAQAAGSTGIVEYKVQSTAAAVSAAFTMSDDDWSVFLATFKAGTAPTGIADQLVNSGLVNTGALRGGLVR